MTAGVIYAIYFCDFTSRLRITLFPVHILIEGRAVILGLSCCGIIACMLVPIGWFGCYSSCWRREGFVVDNYLEQAKSKRVESENLLID